MPVENVALNLYSAQNATTVKRTGTDKFNIPTAQSAVPISPTTKSPSGNPVSSGNSTYDFTDLTQEQVRDLAGKLYQSGQISFQESGFLGAIGAIGPLAAVDPTKASAVSSVHFNALSSLETTISALKQHPSANSPVTALENILSKLQELQGTTSGVNQYA